jgi:SOS-response transcriptional repressor LexA
MNHAVVGDRIKARRKDLKMSQLALANAFAKPVSHTSVCHWENGFAEMSSASLIEVARILKCSVDYLTAESNDIQSDLTKLQSTELPPVPLIPWKYVAEAVKDINNLTPKSITGWLCCPKRHGSQTYALKVLDNAMTQGVSEKQNFSKGSILFVDPMKEPVNGSYVIAKIPGKEIPIFKQYIIDGLNYYLFSHDKNYEPITITGKRFKIYGVVIGSFYDL